MYYDDRFFQDPASADTNDFSPFLAPSGSIPPILSKPILAPTMYDDPAFSPDPHSHPFFVTSRSSWAPSSSQQPRPPSDREVRRPPPISTSRSRPDEPHLLPPNTPMFSDDHSSTTHETSSSSSNHTSTSSASQSTAPTSHDSHSSDPSEPPQSTPWPPEKKKNSISMFWRRSLPDTASKPVDLTPPAQDLPIHSQTPLSARPPAIRNRSTPDVKQSDRPALPPRGATTAVDSKPPPAASRRIIGGRAMRATELDRIDELDESNPLGLPLHHRGPYDIRKAVDQAFADDDPPQNSGRQHQYLEPPASTKERTRPLKHSKRKHAPVDPRQIISVPYVPIGVSLNLQPGQILPHTESYHASFQLGQVTGHVSQSDKHTQHPPHSLSYPLQPPSYPPPDQRRQRPPDLGPSVSDQQDVRHDGIHRSSRRRSMPVEFQGANMDEKAARRDRHSSSSQASSSSFSDFSGDLYQEFDPYLIYDDQRTPRQSLVDQQTHSNGQYITTPNPPPPDRSSSSTPRPSQANTHLPPRMQALQRNKASQNARSIDEPPRHSHHRSQIVNAAFSVENISVQAHASERRRSQMSPQPNYAPVIEMEQPPRFQDNYGLSAPAVQNAFEMAPNYVQEVQRVVSPQPPPPPREQDTWSPPQSVTSSGRSSQSGGSRGHPPPQHIPKRLIMPTPLQPSHPTAPRHQPQPQRQQQSDVLEWPPQLRPASPDLVLPPTLSSHTNVELFRAQDVAMAQGRKLRKRNSVHGIPGSGSNYPSPQAPLSFEPTVGFLDILPPPVSQPSRPPKAEKAPKKVLSKRRTDF